MAGQQCCDYPMLEESKAFYQDLFDKWHGGMDDDENRLEVLGTLREWRRKAMNIYFFGGDESVSGGETGAHSRFASIAKATEAHGEGGM